MMRQLRMPDPKNFKTIPTPSAQKVIPLSFADIVKRENIPTLDDLKTDHMSAEQGKLFLQKIRLFREWDRVRRTQGLSIIICGSYGIGKSYIANCLAHTRLNVEWGIGNEPSLVDGVPNYQVHISSRFMTARDLMTIITRDKHYSPKSLFQGGINTFVIDEIGREGKIDFVKADDQASEIQSRYYEIVNYVATIAPDKRPSLIFTTNLETTELNQVFNGATRSRLSMLAPRPYILNMPKLPNYWQRLGGRD